MGSYTITAAQGTLGAQNYTFTLANGTLSVALATPTVTVSDGGGPYTGSAYPATATVNGQSSLEGVPLSVTYNGSTAAPVTAGTYTVVATFPGSTDYTAATAQTSLTISKAASTVSVADAGGTYTGLAYPAVATVNGQSSLEGVVPLVTYNGSTAAPSTGGTYTVVASFPGSTDYASATSSPVTFTIAPAVTSLTLTTSAAAIVYGQSATLTATVSTNVPGGASPGGTVTFTAGATLLGSATPVNGIAAFTTTAVPAGMQTVTAVYSGDANYAGSTFGSAAAAFFMSTLAGNETAGYSGDNGPATAAELMPRRASPWTARGTSSSPTRPTTSSARSISPRAESSRWPAMAPPVPAATTARPPRRSLNNRRPWRSTPTGTCSSPTQATAASAK